MDLTFIGSGDAFANGGRNQTCLLIKDYDKTFLLDCGPSTLSALKKNNFDVLNIDFILLTHLHGDHFGGIPYLLLDYQYESKRTKDLNIYGPKGIEETINNLQEVLFAGHSINKMNFKINFIEIMPNSINQIEGYELKAYLMEHIKDSDCLGYKVSNSETSFSFTGDTNFVENLFELSDDTDLFICECSLYKKFETVTHLSYEEILENLEYFNSKKIILTHLGSDVLENIANVDIETAYDNLKIRF